MALVCSPNSASEANPSWPASELRDTTGKTTLIVLPVIPRVEVQAELTGLGEEPEDPLVDAVVVDAEPEGEEVPHAAAPTSTAPTTARPRTETERDDGPTRPASRFRGLHLVVAPMHIAPCRPHPAGIHPAGLSGRPNPIEPVGHPQPGAPAGGDCGPADGARTALGYRTGSGHARVRTRSVSSRSGIGSEGGRDGTCADPVCD